MSQNNENLAVTTIRTLSIRVAIEMGITLGWESFVGLVGKILSVDTFGASGDGAAVMKVFGFTTDYVVRISKSVLNPS